MVCFNCGKPGRFQKAYRQPKKGKGKGRAARKVSTTSNRKRNLRRKQDLTGYLEISMIKAMDASEEEGKAPVPFMGFMGVPKRTRDLSKRCYRRLYTCFVRDPLWIGAAIQ